MYRSPITRSRGSGIQSGPLDLPSLRAQTNHLPLPPPPPSSEFALATEPPSSPPSARSRRKSVLRRLSRAAAGSGDNPGQASAATGFTKVVFMPRRDYLRFFARNRDNVYVGTEPERVWTEEELEERWGRFRPIGGSKGRKERRAWGV